MTDGEHTPDAQGPTSPLAAALEEIRPYATAAGAVSLLGAPAEFGVPIVRRLLGRSGVSLGPGLVNLAHGVVALGVVRFFRHGPALEQRWRSGRIPRAVPAAALAYVVLAPAVAGGWGWAVILRNRSPLWGGLLSPIGLLQIAVLGAAFRRARRSRRS